MDKISAKIQYQGYEIGEFSEVMERTYEEIIAVVNDFPWQEQRKKIEIGLTCPSITLEKCKRDYLKLALYYNDKYVLFI